MRANSLNGQNLPTKRKQTHVSHDNARYVRGPVLLLADEDDLLHVFINKKILKRHTTMVCCAGSPIRKLALLTMVTTCIDVVMEKSREVPKL